MNYSTYDSHAVDLYGVVVSLPVAEKFSLTAAHTAEMGRFVSFQSLGIPIWWNEEMITFLLQTSFL